MNDEENWPLTTERIAQVLAKVRRTPCPRSACCMDDLDHVRFSLHIIAEKALAELLEHRAAQTASSDSHLDGVRRSAIAALRNGTTLAEVAAALVDTDERPDVSGADLSKEQLEAFEYHGCSSGTSTQPMVRDAIVRAVAELKRHRSEVAAARVNMAAVGVVEDGPIDQLVCTLVALYLELKNAQTASTERVRTVVALAVASEMREYRIADDKLEGPPMTLFDQERAALFTTIADRVSAQLTAPATSPPIANETRILDLQAAVGYEIERRDAALARLATSEAEVAALTARRDELLALVVKVTRETPYPADLDECRSARSALIAEVGTLRSDVQELREQVAPRGAQERICQLQIQLDEMREAIGALLVEPEFSEDNANCCQSVLDGGKLLPGISIRQLLDATRQLHTLLSGLRKLIGVKE